MDSTDVDALYWDDSHTSENYKYCEAPGCNCFGCMCTKKSEKPNQIFSLVARVSFRFFKMQPVKLF